MAKKAKRDTYRYELKQGRKILQYGITDDPERREKEHRAKGKRFSHTLIVGPRVTEDSARKWEDDKIDAYERRHGRKPRYNK